MQTSLYRELKSDVEKGRLVVLATIVDGPGVGAQLLIRPGEGTVGSLGSERLNQQAEARGEEIAPSFRSQRQQLAVDDAVFDLFFEVLPPPPRLVIVGAVHVAVPLIGFAQTLGFETIVVDPRGVFAQSERFPDADRVIRAWPQEALAEIGLDEGSFLVALSHDFKIDLPALEVALRSPARYIGALGSSKTHAKRVAALEERGFDRLEIDRIHAPIGLDIGGRKAEEIALSIIAQIVAVDHGRHAPQPA